ncbi:MAG: thermonuclease family protein [Hydrogenophilales bacterium]|nr:thermonuclease family protein [Hydrogenophilales bacterium]
MRIALLALILVLPILSWAAELSGRVVGVTDGDTVTLLAAGNVQEKIRLSGIDAPEKGQPYGEASKQALSGLVYGKDVVVDWAKRDRYGRIVGKVLVDGRDACLDQARAGLAWHFKRYENEQSPEDRVSYAAAEVASRAARVGLWADPAPMAPWDWRKR